MVGGEKLAALGEWKLTNSKELSALQEEHAKLVEKTKGLEDENKHYLSQLNRVLTEKDSLTKAELEQRDRLLQQERAQSGEAQVTHTKEQLETKNRYLEQQLEQVTAQKNECIVKLQRAKEVCQLCFSCVVIVLFYLSLLFKYLRNVDFFVVVHCPSGYNHQEQARTEH